jgi:hypothetical protein
MRLSLRAAALTVTALAALGACTQVPGSPNGQFLGIWNATYTDPNFGRVASQQIFGANGSYQRQDQGLDTGALTTIYGSFQVFADQKLLRITIDKGEPSQTCGPLGCNPIIYPKGESYNYGFADANTLNMHFAYCAPNQCNFTYKRQ